MKNLRRGRGYLVHHSVLFSCGDADGMIKVPSEYMAGAPLQGSYFQYLSVIETRLKTLMSILLTPEQSTMCTQSGASI